MSEWKLKRDTTFRKQLFTSDSFVHPAKMDAQLLLRIVETYTKPGDIIADVMAGSGTTMLACTIGRHVILVELEEKYCKMMEANWEKVKMMPQLGYEMGECQIIQDDARQLEELLVDTVINCICSSPPYEGIEARDRSKEGWWDEEREKKFSGGSAKIAKGYQADHIITSPPYENQIHKGSGEWSKSSEGRLIGGSDSLGGKMLGVPQGEDYIKSQDNIGNLKSTSYLEAMALVYAECWKCLRPQGLMILVVKNFIRDKKEVDLRGDTVKLCEKAGFIYIEEHHRILPSQSFWRVIYAQRFPLAPKIDREFVLIFRKE